MTSAWLRRVDVVEGLAVLGQCLSTQVETLFEQRRADIQAREQALAAAQLEEQRRQQEQEKQAAALAAQKAKEQQELEARKDRENLIAQLRKEEQDKARAEMEQVLLEKEKVLRRQMASDDQTGNLLGANGQDKEKSKEEAEGLKRKADHITESQEAQADLAVVVWLGPGRHECMLPFPTRRHRRPPLPVVTGMPAARFGAHMCQVLPYDSHFLQAPLPKGVPSIPPEFIN